MKLSGLLIVLGIAATSVLAIPTPAGPNTGTGEAPGTGKSKKHTLAASIRRF
jgi:hypothetical protein